MSWHPDASCCFSKFLDTDKFVCTYISCVLYHHMCQAAEFNRTSPSLLKVARIYDDDYEDRLDEPEWSEPDHPCTPRYCLVLCAIPIIKKFIRMSLSC